MHRVVITGMGAVTPYGAGVPLLRKALLLESRSALKFSEDFGFMVGAIPDEEDVFQRWTAGQKREMSRASQLALVAAEENNDDIALVSLSGNAFRAIRHGWARRAIAGASEGCVNAVSLAGFDRMRALSHGKVPSCSRPFDRERDGFVLSEGVGLVILERLQDALDRGAPVLAEIKGYGISSDCYHISSPDPSGIGARLSMQRAIEDAKISSDEVNYVNAHATSTPTGDAIEALAIREVFGKRNIAVSSIKGIGLINQAGIITKKFVPGHIGHLLAAAGAVEVIATVEAIRVLGTHYRQLPTRLNDNNNKLMFFSQLTILERGEEIGDFR
ncbi:Beta-ketoacyl synthase protein, partial [Teladorsagia circumcincta]